MQRFSERYGYRQPRSIAQVEEMDDALRIGLWNSVTVVFDQLEKRQYVFQQTNFYRFGLDLWDQFFGWPQDELHRMHEDDFRRAVRKWYMAAEWHEVYDFIQYVASTLSPPKSFIDRCNAVMERELAGYRFVHAMIAPITSPEELLEVDSAIGKRSEPVTDHLLAALALFSDRESPNYRKAVDESILAVEAAIRKLTGNPKAMLGQGLKALDVDLHAALKGAFDKLYGYASDEGGIRHALTDSARPIDQADARYMLVACSAFVNYLRAKSGQELA